MNWPFNRVALLTLTLILQTSPYFDRYSQGQCFFQQYLTMQSKIISSFIHSLTHSPIHLLYGSWHTCFLCSVWRTRIQKKNVFFKWKKLKHNISHFIFQVHLGSLFQQNNNICSLFFSHLLSWTGANVHDHSFFLLEDFIWDYSTSPTAHTDNKGFQPRGGIVRAVQEKLWKVKKFKHDESNFSLNSC